MNNFISPAIADVMLWLMYITLAAAIAVTAYSVWHGLRFRRKGDDVVNGTDIQAVINFIVTDVYDAKADVNEDGFVNGTDIQEIINIIVSGE